MPRKQNGWGNKKSLDFKQSKSVSVGKGWGKSVGSYPSERRYGTSVTRSVVEHMDLNSDWSKWRKGYEYYMKAAWAELVVENPFFGVGGRLDPVDPDDPAPGEKYMRATLQSKLYREQTMSYPPCSTAGSSLQVKQIQTHYVAKRTPEPGAEPGTVTGMEQRDQVSRTKKESRNMGERSGRC